MTRKRYVKLLMGYGYTRNLAQARAAIDLPSHGSYARAFKALEPYFKALEPYFKARGAIRDICAKLVSTWKAIQPRLCRAARDIIDALASTGDSREVAHE